MQYFRKDRAAAQRFVDRRQREDDAPRLASEVPDLTSLGLTVEERFESNSLSQPKHLRRIIVGGAPALFLIPCGDPKCLEGGHDVTAFVMHSLRRRERSFEGEDRCSGSLGPSPCLRVLHYQGTAEYRERPATTAT
jgi:hypothetical protein